MQRDSPASVDGGEWEKPEVSACKFRGGRVRTKRPEKLGRT